MRPDRRAELCGEYYEALIAAIRYTARRCGYAIGVHGSLKNDIDLMAVVWRDSAPGPEHLIERIRETVKAIVGEARFRPGDPQPTKKPCGRLAWSIYLTPDDEGPYLDISVMAAKEEPRKR